MNQMKTEKSNWKMVFLLHIFLMVSSFFGIASKLAAQESFLSARFIILYGVVLCNLGVYAIIWQQMLTKMSLVTAYANKAVGVIWGIIWGRVFFREVITIQKIIGAAVIICGIILVVTEKEKEDD